MVATALTRTPSRCSSSGNMSFASGDDEAIQEIKQLKMIVGKTRISDSTVLRHESNRDRTTFVLASDFQRNPSEELAVFSSLSISAPENVTQNWKKSRVGDKIFALRT